MRMESRESLGVSGHDHGRGGRGGTLLSLQKQAVPATVRLGAAGAILEIGMKLREFVDLETQLAELNATIEQMKQQGQRRIGA